MPQPDSPTPPDFNDFIRLTVTQIRSYLFCPRFIYFEHVLCIPQHAELRWKVQQARLVHLQRRRINPKYLRKKLGVVARQFDVPLFSRSLDVRGVVDELLTLADGSMAPLDYKFALTPKHLYRGLRYQSILYGLLISDTFSVPVHRGFICFTRSNYQIVEVPISDRDRHTVRRLVRNILDIIRTGLFPKATRWKRRCADCCYKNICVQ